MSKKNQNQNQAIDCKGHSMWKWIEAFKDASAQAFDISEAAQVPER